MTAIDDRFEATFGHMLQNKTAILHIYNSVGRDGLEGLMNYCEYADNACLLSAFGNKTLGERDSRAIARFLKREFLGSLSIGSMPKQKRRLMRL